MIAAFFKGAKAKEREAARAEVQAAVEMGGPDWRERARAAHRRPARSRPFHWPLEFPEVFDRPNGGFDAIVGNPPFAGKNTHHREPPGALPRLAEDPARRARTATPTWSPTSSAAPSISCARAARSA